MFRNLAHMARLFRLVRTLARYGALFPLGALDGASPVVRLLRLFERRAKEGRPGERLAQALQSLGPTFIKLGQSLAVRGDLIGDAVADDLAQLQDALPPFPTAEAKATVERDLGRPLGEDFAEFEETSVAAASIAQVHLAVTGEGRPVAVKILRPGIEGAFARDLRFFYWLARALERHFPELRRLRPVEVVRSLEETVTVELDLRLEASAASELGENFRDDPEFRVPAVDWARTGQRVLTLERVEGIPIDEVDALRAAGLEPRDILARSARTFFNQVFRDGFFHADMHPGNMFVTTDGVLRPVDFGIMGRIDRRTRNFLADMLLAFLRRDYERVADVHFAAGYVPRDKSRDAFAQAARAIAEPILGRPQNEISIARLLGQLFHVTRTFEMETQPQLLLLQKTMLVAEGVGRRLDPDINMWILAEPLVEDWMRENRGPEARIADGVAEIARRIEQMPALLTHIDNLADMVTAEGLRIHPETLRAVYGERGAQGRVWRQAALILAAALVILALL